VIRARVREAADRFPDGASDGHAWGNHVWGKVELATWLVDDYARACVTVSDSHAVGARTRDSHIELKAVTQLIEEACALVQTHRAGLARMGLRTPWLAPLIQQGVVVALRDPSGQLVFAPATRDGLRLYERVLSLEVADFLNEGIDKQSSKLARFFGRDSGVFSRAQPDE